AAAARERDRQLREGRSAPARQDRIRRATRFRASDRARHVCRAGGQSAMSAIADTLMLGAMPASRQREINPWIIAVTVTLATFMELLDTSIANVSLPHIAGGLSTGQDESTWVLSSYLVANAVVLPLSAWLSRLMGRKNYYMLSVALFTASSLLCGLA